MNEGSTARQEPRPTTLHEDAPPYRAGAPISKSALAGSESGAPTLGQGTALRFIDLFCGIGGFRIAFERAGGKCVFSSDWDKFSRQTYAANFGETPLCPSLAVAGEGGRRPGEGCGAKQTWPTFRSSTSCAAAFPASPSASRVPPRRTASAASTASIVTHGKVGIPSSVR